MSLPTPYYEDEAVTLYCGDARDILPELESAVMVTDPPYGVNHSCGWEGPLKNVRIANDQDPRLRDEVLSCWHGPAIVFGTWRSPRPSCEIRAVLVWDKGSWGMGDLALPWTPSWEEIYVIGHGFAGRRSNGVLRFNAPQTAHGRLHPNEKPAGLMSELVYKCPPGDIVDPFAGSGTTLLAAKNLNRKAIGVEISEEYCQIAVQRLAQGVLPLESA